MGRMMLLGSGTGPEPARGFFHKLERIILPALIFLVLLGPSVARADTPRSAQADADPLKDPAVKQVLLEREVASQRERVSSEVANFKNHIERQYIILGAFSGLLGLIFLGSGLLSYFAAKREAENYFKENAEEVKKEVDRLGSQVDTFTNTKLPEAERRLNELLERISQGHDHLDEVIGGLDSKREEVLVILEQYLRQEDFQVGLEEKPLAGKPDNFEEEVIPVQRPVDRLSQEQKDLLDQTLKSLESKADRELVYEDWKTRALIAEGERDITSAASFWKRAAESKDVTDLEKAESSLRLGDCLRQLISPWNANRAYGMAVYLYEGDSGELLDLDDALPAKITPERVELGRIAAKAKLGQAQVYRGIRGFEAYIKEEELEHLLLGWNSPVEFLADSATRAQAALLLCDLRVERGAFQEALDALNGTSFQYADEEVKSEVLAKVLMTKARLLKQIERRAEAREAFQAFWRQFSDHPDPEFHSDVLQAMVSELELLDDLEDAQQLMARIESRFGSPSDNPYTLANGFLRFANILFHNNQKEEAEKYFNKLTALYPHLDDQDRLIMECRRLDLYGSDVENAEDNCGDGDVSQMEDLELLYFIQRAEELSESSRFKEALSACEDALRICRAAGPVKLGLQTLKALHLKASILGKSGQFAAAARTLKEYIQESQLMDRGEDSALWQARFDFAKFLERNREFMDALAAYQALVHDAHSENAIPAPTLVAKAQAKIAALHDQIGNTQEALGALEDLTLRFGDANEPDLRKVLAEAYRDRAKLLARKLNQPGDAAAAYEDLLSFLEGAVEAWAKSMIISAKRSLAKLAAATGPNNA